MGWITVAIALVALITPYLLGWVRHPKLDIGIGDITGEGKSWRFLHLRVYNKPLGPPWRWVERREPATSCHVELSFFRLSNKEPVFGPLLARWSATPEPLRPTVVGDKLLPVVEPTLVVAGERYSLDASDEGSAVAVAVKHEGEAEAYAFNGYSYYYPKWSNPDWQLPNGEYLVRATAISGQESVIREFKLINHGTTFERFRLKSYASKYS